MCVRVTIPMLLLFLYDVHECVTLWTCCVLWWDTFAFRMCVLLCLSTLSKME